MSRTAGCPGDLAGVRLLELAAAVLGSPVGTSTFAALLPLGRELVGNGTDILAGLLLRGRPVRVGELVGGGVLVGDEGVTCVVRKLVREPLADAAGTGLRLLLRDRALLVRLMALRAERLAGRALLEPSG